VSEKEKTMTDSIDSDVIKATAFTTYRCWRGCLLGYVSKVPGWGVVFSHRIEGEWRATTDPYDEPLYCGCRHLKGLLPVNDRPQGRVSLTQEDVRTLPPRD
jgi:hypothetical protein